MAYANFNLPSRAGTGTKVLQALIQKRGQDVSAQTEIKKAGFDLQKARMSQDVELEKVRTQAQKDLAIAKFNAGIGLQLKQMGIDSDITIQKMRNLNSLELVELKGKVDTMVERLKNKNVQDQILKQYQVNLELANYNAKQALERTMLEVYGDIFKHGDPASNAIDAAAFGIWSIAFTAAMNHLSLDAYTDRTKKDSQIGDPSTIVKQEEPGNGKTTDEIIKEATEAFNKGKSGQQNKGKERYAKPGLLTRLQVYENQRSGNKAWKR